MLIFFSESPDSVVGLGSCSCCQAIVELHDQRNPSTLPSAINVYRGPEKTRPITSRREPLAAVVVFEHLPVGACCGKDVSTGLGALAVGKGKSTNAMP